MPPNATYSTLPCSVLLQPHLMHYFHMFTNGAHHCAHCPYYRALYGLICHCAVMLIFPMNLAILLCTIIFATVLYWCAPFQSLPCSLPCYSFQVFIKLDRTWKTSQSMVGITGPQPDPVAREPMPTPPITPPLDAAIPSTTPGSTPGTSPALKPTAAPTVPATATSDGPSSGHSSIHAMAGSVAPWLPHLTASLLVLFALWLVLLMMRLEAVQVRLSSVRSAGAVCPSTADPSSTRGVHDDEMRLELTALQTQVQRLIDRLG